MRQTSSVRVALSGLLTLAVAMGIGRFAFTPLLPMMEKDTGLSLARGGWLAAANYLGYFLGALSAIRLRFAPSRIVLVSLLAIGGLTAAMGVTDDQAAWLVLRGLAGVASAWALIFASAWGLQVLAAAGASRLTGVMYAGVGFGIALTGVLCLVFFGLGWSAAQVWIALGTVAWLLTFLAAPGFRAAARSRGDAYSGSIACATRCAYRPAAGDRLQSVRFRLHPPRHFPAGHGQAAHR